MNKTNAAQNDRIIILDHSAIWYTAEGGITALDYMLQDIETCTAMGSFFIDKLFYDFYDKINRVI